MKRKFVKVVFFGALAFAVSTAVTSCKDYDDDVKNLQEQLDKITSKSPVSTEDMTAAVQAAKAELQGKVDNLQAALNDKAAESKLQSEIKRLEDALKTAVGQDASNLAGKLADVQNQLKTLQDAKADKTYVQELEKKITDLKAMETTLSSLIAAEKAFKESGDISGYKNTGFAKFVNQSIADALNENAAIANYVDKAVKSGMTAQMSAINASVAAKTGNAIASLEDFVGKVYNEIYKDETGILSRLDQLEEYSDAIDAFIKKNNANYADYAAILAQIEENRLALAGIMGVDEGFDKKIKDIVNGVLTAADGELAKMKTELQKEINALKGMIQSVAYVPMTSDRKVNFTTLYAKKKATDVDYKTITLAGASTQKVKFRISPASSADAFVANYDVAFSADQVITRASNTEQFVQVGEPEVEGGFVTYTIKSNATNSFVVCMHVSTKTDKVATLGPTDITSDYFAAMITEKYVVDAYYKVAADVNKEITYDVKDSKADYEDAGEIVLSVSDDKTGSAPAEAKLTDYPGFDATALATTFSVSNTTYFAIAGSAVTLKAYETPSYVGQTTDVNVKVAATGFYTPATAKKIGTVTVTKTTKKASIDYGTIDATWSNAQQTVAATKFPLNKIYDDANVKLTLSEFQNLTGAVVSEAGDKVKFAIGAGNALTAVVDAQTPEGSYSIKAKFTSDGREITVVAIVNVKNPVIASLATDPHLWGGTAEAGKVGFTPTLDQDAKPNSISMSYDLSNLFTNYAAVQTAITNIPGASLNISIPDVAKIIGVTYDAATTTLSFNKDTYTGKTTDNKVAKVQVVATVTLAGTTTPLQKYTADVNINNISGSWKAGKVAVSLDNKASSYKLAEGFIWNDMRGKAMWKAGKEITGGTDFADNVKALSIYGLTVPTFKFVDEKGVDTTCPYLTVDATTGELSFTSTGKNYNFVTDYPAYIMVTASSQWGTIDGYAGNNIIKVTIPANVK